MALELAGPPADADLNSHIDTWILIVAAVVLGGFLLRDCIRGSQE